MDQEETFLAAIDEDPEDWTLRLVFADWLEEQGRDVQAACLRWMARKKKRPYPQNDHTFAW